MKKRSLALLLTFVISLPAVALAASEHWPNFRGPHLNGSANAAGLPEQWSREEGVLWSTPLPGVGTATPAIWGNRIFLTSVDAATNELLAIGLDAADGKVLWKRAHGTNRKQGAGDMTSPSPVTDGQRAVFLLGTGQLVAYDFAGVLLWQRDLVSEFGALSWLFGYGASPLLYDGRLYVQMMRRPTHRSAPDAKLESFLLAIDPATGKDLWKQPRPGEALEESWESYITPLVHPAPSGPQIVLAGADSITGHDPQSGQELWRYNFNAQRQRNWRLVPTPVSDGERLFLALPRGVEFLAISPDKGEASLEERTQWNLTPNAPDVCSPLLYDGHLYVLDGDRRVVTCLDPETGRQIWRGQLGGDTVIRSSPTAADGKIYFVDERGLVFVLAAGDQFRILSRIEMGGGQPARSSIAIANNRLYIRTADALHCIAAP